MSNTHPVHDVSGRCLCGSVRYQVSAVRRELIHCHCEICRRMTGAVWIGTHAVRSDLTIEDDDCLAWYQSTDHGSRGFCRKCGSTLFFLLIHESHPVMSARYGMGWVRAAL